jgi:hypothetical protein
MPEQKPWKRPGLSQLLIAERREEVRHTFDPPRPGLTVRDDDGHVRPALVVDASASGMAFLTGQRYERGDWLTLEAPGDGPSEPPRRAPACVKNVEAGWEGLWRVGCLFLHRLELHQLPVP